MSKPATIKLNRAAKIFGVHPRTLLRHVEGDVTAYWVPSRGGVVYDPPLDIDALCDALDMDPAILRRVQRGTDELMKPPAMAKYLGLKIATFRYHSPPPVIKFKNLVRYSRKDTAAFMTEVCPSVGTHS